MTNTIAIASDHAGIDLKAYLLEQFPGAIDLGPTSKDSVDYPDFAHKLADWIKQDSFRKGILICGSGIGMSIAANRHKKIRAALVQTAEAATLARKHNDANVLCLGARFLNDETALACALTFFATEFEGGRHETRVKKLG